MSLQNKSFLKLFELLDSYKQKEAFKNIVDLLNPTYYILFNSEAGYSSNDIHYELEYMYYGIYSSYEEAFKYVFDIEMEYADIEEDDARKEILRNMDISNIDDSKIEKSDNFLRDNGWRIINTKLFE